MAIGLVRRAMPARRQAFVYGMPATEGNAVEVVRALLDRYPGDVYWPGAPSDAFLHAAGIRPSSRLVRGPDVRTTRSLREYIRSEIVFSTHGLYGMPPSSAARPVIDLWHGACSKSGGSLYPGRRLSASPSTLMTSASRLLTTRKLEMAGMPVDRSIWVANLRVAQLSRPASDDMLHRLGLDSCRPLVMWMPTWRCGVASLRGALNTRDIEADQSLATTFARDVVPRLAAAGLQTVVKPHPLDAEARSTSGAVVLSQADLDRAGVPLYRLLGRAAGLITDYSSVWIDYLSLDRPIGFYMPDRAAYDRGAGSSLTEAYDRLPGPELSEARALDDFAAELCGEHCTSLLRASARDHLGLWHGEEPATALLEELRCRGLIRLT